MGHLTDFEEARTPREKALAAISCSRAKASRMSAWQWAETAIHYACEAGVMDAEKLVEKTRYPGLEPLEKALKSLVDQVVIVSRHQGMIEWLRRRGIVGRVVVHASIEDVKDQPVVGPLPYRLAAVAASVTVIDLPKLSPALRGVDLSPEQMDEAGAQIATYQVRRYER